MGYERSASSKSASCFACDRRGSLANLAFLPVVNRTQQVFEGATWWQRESTSKGVAQVVGTISCLAAINHASTRQVCRPCAPQRRFCRYSRQTECQL
jgi:hypothetical protein